MDGRFDGNCIIADLEIISPLVDSVRKTLPITVDTGCTGDLILTYTEAFPLALTLVGLQEYTIADGSKVTFFECFGKVKFGSKTVLCTVSIRPSGSLLMGVSLLKKFGYKLEIDFVNNTASFTEPSPQPSAITPSIQPPKSKKD
jgi:predicted aspartyl protease